LKSQGHHNVPKRVACVLFLSNSKLVVISQVLADAIPAANAACLARHEANLVLLLADSTEENVGTNRISVPSGNLLE
jgi:hypothetical protein